MTTIRGWAWLALLALTMVTSGARAQTALTFAWNPSPETLQVAQAVDVELWKGAGLDIKLVAFPTGREAFEALLGGQVDVAAMAEFPAVTGALRAQRFRVIADVSRYKRNRLIATAKKIDLSSLADLAGRKIGTTLGTNVDFLANLMLTRAGVSAEIVNAGPADLVPALVRGDIDAAVPFPNFYIAAKKTLGDAYREIVSPDYYMHFIIAASADALDKRSKTVEQFLAVLVKADQQVAADPSNAQAALARAMHGLLDLEAIKAVQPEYEYRVTLDTGLLDLMVEEGAWIVKRGLVKVETADAKTFRAYLDEAPLKTVAADRVRLP